MTERRKRLRTSAVLVILAALALVALWCDINAGYRSISLEELGQILSGTASQSLTYTLVDLRLPRVLTSLLVGVGLSLSGCLLQGVSRNDMADPGVLGINAGAGLLVAAFIVFVPAGLFPSAVALPVLAFAGSAAVAFLGWRLSVVRGASSPRRLLLIGVALATGLSSATSLLMLRMSDGDYAFVQNWIAGSIWGASWENVAILAVGLALLVAGALYASRTLNVLGLGEAAATGLGVNVPRARAALTAVAVGASGLACAVGGGLTFVGLVCPHMARRLVGPNFRVLVPACVLVGAVLMLLADIISRTLLAPNEIPVGIVAAVIGAPYFLYLLAKS
ncbi:MAG: FecCD family ABC transporter permease [Adlercreutzia equolifaciens subsp. celatus]|uniref:FecCD family ABC transporter permease n=1 Tax=Adlercreutzia equolifaciens TaxID=446660 RepID=UPI0039958548